MSYAVVFGGVDDAIGLDRVFIEVRKDLEFRAGGLAHRPGERLFVDADRNQLRSRSFNVVVILSQPGELRSASTSPKAAIEDKDHRAALRVLGKRHELAVAVRKSEIGRLIAKLQGSRFSGCAWWRKLRRTERG